MNPFHEPRRLHGDDLQLLMSIDSKLDRLLKGNAAIMADIDTLNTLIDGLSTDFDELETELTAAQQAAQNNQPVDLSGAISKLSALKDKADQATQALNAPAPTPTPTDTSTQTAA